MEISPGVGRLTVIRPARTGFLLSQQGSEKYARSKVEGQTPYRGLRCLLTLSLVHRGLFIGALLPLFQLAAGGNIAESLPNFDLIYR